MNSFPLAIGLAGFVLVSLLALVAAVLAWRVVSGLRSRLHELLAAVQLTQRQLTELRSTQDALAVRVEETARRLAERIEPRLDGVGNYLKAEQTAQEVRRARKAGTVSEETARQLLDELQRVGEETLAGESPY